jgi:hypothetical protein
MWFFAMFALVFAAAAYSIYRAIRRVSTPRSLDGARERPTRVDVLVVVGSFALILAVIAWRLFTS